MTIPPLPTERTMKPVHDGCEVVIGNGKMCPHEAVYILPFGQGTIVTCPFHGGQIALLETGGMSWMELLWGCDE